MRTLRTWLFAAVLCPFFSLHAATFHAVLLVDTEAEHIETAMENNLSRLQKEFKKIALFTGLNIQEHIFKARELNTGNIFPFLQSLTVGGDDVVFFYFCGHGYRTSEKESPWPYLCFSCEHVAVDFSIIAECLKNKAPRFMIAFGECCNHFIDRPDQGPVRQSWAGNNQTLKRNYQTLFLQSRGMITLSSSTPGEYSWAWVGRGSCFTLAFLESLGKEVRSKKKAEWAAVFQKAALKVADLQTPQIFYELD